MKVAGTSRQGRPICKTIVLDSRFMGGTGLFVSTWKCGREENAELEHGSMEGTEACTSSGNRVIAFDMLRCQVILGWPWMEIVGRSPPFILLP